MENAVENNKKLVLIVPEDEEVGQKMIDIINTHYPNDEEVTFSFVKERSMFDFVVEKLEEYQQKSDANYHQKLIDDFKNNPVNKANSFALAVRISFLVGKTNAGWFNFDRIKRKSTIKSKDYFLSIINQGILFGFIVEDDNLPGNFKVTIHPEQKIQYFEGLILEKQKDIFDIRLSIEKENLFIEQQKKNGLFVEAPDFLNSKEFSEAERKNDYSHKDKLSEMMFGGSEEVQPIKG